MVSNTASILGGGLLLPVKTYMAEIIVQDLINTYAYGDDTHGGRHISSLAAWQEAKRQA